MLRKVDNKFHEDEQQKRRDLSNDLESWFSCSRMNGKNYLQDLASIMDDMLQ